MILNHEAPVFNIKGGQKRQQIDLVQIHVALMISTLGTDSTFLLREMETNQLCLSNYLTCKTWNEFLTLVFYNHKLILFQYFCFPVLEIAQNSRVILYLKLFSQRIPICKCIQNTIVHYRTDTENTEVNEINICCPGLWFYRLKCNTYEGQANIDCNYRLTDP